MSTMSWVTSWEAWRWVMGHSGSRQRANVMKYLGSHPAILYWGDSWFSTPLYLNLARQSARRIQGLGMIIGKPGAEAAELFSTREVERLGSRIENNPFDLVCLSAGGNDCLSDRLAAAFPQWTGTHAAAKKITGDEAYAIFSAGKTLDRVANAYERVLARLQKIQKRRPHLRVIGHPYVPVEFVGRKAELTTANIGLIAWVKDSVGPWLWEPMRHVVKDKDEARKFGRLMLEKGFRDTVLLRLAEKYEGLFSVADFSGVRGMGADAFWNDEIHPSEAGFALLSSSFNSTLRGVLPKAKQAAVSG